MHRNKTNGVVLRLLQVILF